MENNDDNGFVNIQLSLDEMKKVTSLRKREKKKQEKRQKEFKYLISFLESEKNNLKRCIPSINNFLNTWNSFNSNEMDALKVFNLSSLQNEDISWYPKANEFVKNLPFDLKSLKEYLSLYSDSSETEDIKENMISFEQEIIEQIEFGNLTINLPTSLSTISFIRKLESLDYNLALNDEGDIIILLISDYKLINYQCIKITSGKFKNNLLYVEPLAKGDLEYNNIMKTLLKVKTPIIYDKE